MKYSLPASLTIIIIILLSLAAGCSMESDEHLPKLPMPITQDDQCHVCGMAIFGFPGPKGEAFIDNNSAPMKFCSTGDMLAYLLQPDVSPRIHKAWVHDMGTTGWDNPSDNAFIDARKAWYVINHPLNGAMGATLATFKIRDDADRFAEKYSARVLAFDEITLDTIKNLHGH